MFHWRCPNKKEEGKNEHNADNAQAGYGESASLSIDDVVDMTDARMKLEKKT